MKLLLFKLFSGEMSPWLPKQHICINVSDLDTVFALCVHLPHEVVDDNFRQLSSQLTVLIWQTLEYSMPS